jgi:hypothetical protein
MTPAGGRTLSACLVRGVSLETDGHNIDQVCWELWVESSAPATRLVSAGGVAAARTGTRFVDPVEPFF